MKNKNSFHYNNEIKQNKNYMYKDLKRSNCYGSDFTGSNFNFTSFRGAHFKSCNFFGCTFTGAEFVGTNLKKSKFKRCKFINTIFEGVNIFEVDFRDAEFENVIFVSTNLNEAKNLNFDEEQVRVFEDMPEINISKNLEDAINLAMKNEKIKDSRVLDTREGKINSISIIILLENFSEKVLVSGLKLMAEKLDKDFCTLSYVIKIINTYIKQGII